MARQYLTDHATFVRTARMWTGARPSAARFGPLACSVHDLCRSGCHASSLCITALRLGQVRHLVCAICATLCMYSLCDLMPLHIKKLLQALSHLAMVLLQGVVLYVPAC